MDSVIQEIDKYKSAISEYLAQSRLEESAMNIRHILEVILSEYVKRFAPEYIYAKSIDKITKLSELNIIDEISENSLHQMRKLGNRAAHRDENLPINKEEIEIMLPVIDLEINSLVNRIKGSEASDNTENNKEDNTERPFDEEWVLPLYNSSNTISEMNHLISVLEKYPEEQAKYFINRCKEKKQEIYESVHAKEIYLDEIKTKFFYPANKLIAFNGSRLRARCITGSDVLLSEGKLDFWLKENIKVFTWKNVKKIRENYALFYNGKIGIAYQDKKSEYFSDSSFGIWDDVVDFELCKDSKYNRMNVCAVTNSGRIRTTCMGSGKYASWNNICKIFVKDSCYGRPPTLIGLEKDGTVHMADEYGSHYEEEFFCLELSKIRNICDIQFLSSRLIVLTADGNVIDLFDSRYSKKYFPGLEEWEDIIQIRVEFSHIIGLKSNGTVVGIKADDADVRPDCCDTENWKDIVAIFSSRNLSIGLKANGHIVSCGRDANRYKARICYNVFKFEEECEKWKQKNQLMSQIEKIKKSHNVELQKSKNMLGQVDNQISRCEQKLECLYEEKARSILAFSKIFDIQHYEKELKKLLKQKENIVNELNSIQYQIESEIKPYQEKVEVFDKMFRDDEMELFLTNGDSTDKRESVL